jgi:hypothetical protein
MAVTQVEEGKMAVISPPMHPPRQRHALAGMLEAQLTAGVASEGGAHGRRHGSR